MIRLPTTNLCPRCNKPRHKHTENEKVICSAWCKENLTPSPKAKPIKYKTGKQLRNATKFFTAGDN